MATVNGPNVSTPGGDVGNFFSQFFGVANQAATLANQITPLWQKKKPDPETNSNGATFAGPAVTTGTVTGVAPNYIPWIIGGVGLLAVVFLIAKE